jgi:hypothetical protein
LKICAVMQAFARIHGIYRKIYISSMPC